MSLITIEDLSLDIANTPILKNLSLQIGQERFGLVGESGSGKSLLAKTLLGVLPLGATVRAKTLKWQDRDLLGLTEKEWRGIRGSELAMILQEAKSSLNPLMRIGKQLKEVSGDTCPLAALEEAHLSDVKKVSRLYPHELSGGMAQRVMIALMLLQRPKFLIADEIVSALDTPLQRDILRLLQERVNRDCMGLLYISHDLQQACDFCDRIGIMQEGELIAVGTPSELQKSTHPYVQCLFDAILPETPL